jgi:prevent-host-death family protein
MLFATSHEVAKSFGQYQDRALADQPVAVTRYGRPTVVILSYAEYLRLRGEAPERPRREVFRAADMPDDLVEAIERARVPAEAEAFNREVDGDEPA